MVVRDEDFFWYAVPEHTLPYFKQDMYTLSTRDMYLKYKRYSLHDTENHDELEKHMVCSATGERMNEGWKVTQFGFNFKYEHHAFQWCLECGFSSIEEAIKEGALLEIED